MHRLLAAIAIVPTMLLGMLQAQQADPRIEPVNASANLRVQNPVENQEVSGSSSSFAQQKQSAQNGVVWNRTSGYTKGAARAVQYVPSRSDAQGPKPRMLILGISTTSSIGAGPRSKTRPNSKQAGGAQSLPVLKNESKALVANPADEGSSAVGLGPVKLAFADRAKRSQDNQFGHRSVSSRVANLKSNAPAVKEPATWQQRPYQKLGRNYPGAKTPPSVRSNIGGRQQKRRLTQGSQNR